ncbi:MAG TPA: glycosyltransferase family A protein [Candidatus Binatia bacterium]|nr:glycosyltransferase family A protein [Candidatus Binatia bacterium]
MVPDPVLDVLIPTCRRPAALAVTLAALVGQRDVAFRVVVADQTEDGDPFAVPEVRAVCRVLEATGRPVETRRNLPRRGLAEQRRFLLGRARAPYVLFLDDDVILEPWALGALHRTIRAEGCGFVGAAVVGLSHAGDVRPAEEAIEFWDGPVRPERIEPGEGAWHRHRLHNAANLLHVARRLGLDARRPRTYRVAWVGGCVLYDAAKLRAVGGFEFWRELPVDHCGEDVVAQLRVMERFGGCGLVPSGAYHQELPTTVPDRRVDAPRVLE